MSLAQIGLIGGITAGGIIFILVLYIFVISKSHIKKQMREMQRKFSYLDALLVGQDTQYIHRLETISRTNLLYVEKHSYFSLKFQDLYENKDRNIDSQLKQLNTLMANHQYKNIKNRIDDTKTNLDAFEKEVNVFNKELYGIIKLEEESRQEILTHKERFRKLKQSYLDIASSITLVGSSIEKVFAKLEESFAQYDAHVDNAEYEETKNIIPTIEHVLESMGRLLSVMPDLCALVEGVVPNQIKELTDEYEKVVHDSSIPLHHLQFNKKASEWHAKLNSLKKELKNLKVSNVRPTVETIQKEMEHIHDSMGLESEDKVSFEEKLNKTYAESVELEKTYIKICSLLPEIKKVYVIDEDRLTKINELQTIINRLTAARNTLDTYVHSSAQQPYSVLLNKLNELEKEYESSKTGVVDFKAYIDSLKTITEEAYGLVFVYYYRCKQVEYLIRSIAVDDVTNQYAEQINSCYTYINEVDIAVKNKPINVKDLSQRVEQLKTYANVLFDDIEDKYRSAQLAESAIIYANRDREAQSEVDSRLNELEQSFYHGDFNRVYQEANLIYRQNHVENQVAQNNGK